MPVVDEPFEAHLNKQLAALKKSLLAEHRRFCKELDRDRPTFGGKVETCSETISGFIQDDFAEGGSETGGPRSVGNDPTHDCCEPPHAPAPRNKAIVDEPKNLAPSLVIDDCMLPGAVGNEGDDVIRELEDGPSRHAMETEHIRTEDHIEAVSREHQSGKHRYTLNGVKCVQTEEMEDEEIAKALVWYRRMDPIMGCVVVVNLLCMFVEAQLLGMDSGYRMYGYGGFVYSKSARLVLLVIECVFVSLYSIEAIIKIVVQRHLYFMVVWNWVDVAVLAGSYANILLSEDRSVAVRTLRLARLLRMTRLFYAVDIFDSCVLLIRSVVSSLQWLLMTMIFILVLTCTCALIITQLLGSYFENDERSLQERIAVFAAFGTFTRSTMSMFELMLGNWGPPSWLLINYVNEGFMPFCILFKATAGFAMLNVVMGVFLRQTSACAESIDQFTIRQKKKARSAHTKRLQELFHELDTSGDGTLSYEEFAELLKSDSIASWISLLGVTTNDAHHLFSLLDDGDGTISLEEFTNGFSRLQGDATAVDAMTMMASISRIESTVTSFKEMLRETLV